MHIYAKNKTDTLCREKNSVLDIRKAGTSIWSDQKELLMTRMGYTKGWPVNAVSFAKDEGFWAVPLHEGQYFKLRIAPVRLCPDCYNIHLLTTL